MKKDREMLRKYAEQICSDHKPYVIGETKPCQHYNTTVGGDYCNECHTHLRQTNNSEVKDAKDS